MARCRKTPALTYLLQSARCRAVAPEQLRARGRPDLDQAQRRRRRRSTCHGGGSSRQPPSSSRLPARCSRARPPRARPRAPCGRRRLPRAPGRRAAGLLTADDPRERVPRVRRAAHVSRRSRPTDRGQRRMASVWITTPADEGRREALPRRVPARRPRGEHPLRRLVLDEARGDDRAPGGSRASSRRSASPTRRAAEPIAAPTLREAADALAGEPRRRRREHRLQHRSAVRVLLPLLGDGASTRSRRRRRRPRCGAHARRARRARPSVRACSLWR